MKKMLRILRGHEEKRKTRPLYERIFPEDSKEFLDFYYEKRCRDNFIAAAELDGSIHAMVHCNPYRMKIMGRETKACYIYAVATDPAFRKQGLMRELLELSFREMKKEGIPFSYLIPVEEAIYTPFSFVTVGKRTERLSGIWDDRTSFESALTEAELERIDGELVKHFDLYCVEDRNYLEIQSGEAKTSGEEGLPEHPCIMLRVIDPKKCEELFFPSEQGKASLHADSPETVPPKTGQEEEKSRIIKTGERVKYWFQTHRIYLPEDI